MAGDEAASSRQPEKPRHPEKAHRPDQPLARKPDWIRVKAPGSAGWAETNAIIKANKLVTVCEEASCPNMGECWEKKHATFMIMGDTCTRACAFCNVKTGLPGPLDASEPAHIGEATAKLGLTHVVVTSVDRDDLDDGGAAHFAAVIASIRAASPATTIEILTPDFLRKPGALEVVVAARPDVFNHNLETVPSKYLKVRPAGFQRQAAKFQLLFQNDCWHLLNIRQQDRIIEIAVCGSQDLIILGNSLNKSSLENNKCHRFFAHVTSWRIAKSQAPAGTFPPDYVLSIFRSFIRYQLDIRI